MNSIMNLINLFIRPQTFFSARGDQPDRLWVILGAWIVGAASAADQIDKKLLQAEVKGHYSESLLMVTQSWVGYWALVWGVGVTWAIFLWFFAGAWYRARLRWSGAHEPDKQLARRTYMQQSLVHALPALLVAALYTVQYPSYLEAWHAPGFSLSVVALAMLFFSCWTSYVAATTVFQTNAAKAFLWFLVLPAVFYAVVLGALLRYMSWPQLLSA